MASPGRVGRTISRGGPGINAQPVVIWKIYRRSPRTSFPGPPCGKIGDKQGTWLVHSSPLQCRSVKKGDPARILGGLGETSCCGGGEDPSRVRGFQLHWNERLGGGYSASPIIAGGRIYFINEAGIASVLALGKIFKLLGKNDLGERTLASPSVADQALFIRTAKHIWRCSVRYF